MADPPAESQATEMQAGHDSRGPTGTDPPPPAIIDSSRTTRSRSVEQEPQQQQAGGRLPPRPGESEINLPSAAVVHAAVSQAGIEATSEDASAHDQQANSDGGGAALVPLAQSVHHAVLVEDPPPPENQKTVIATVMQTYEAVSIVENRAHPSTPAATNNSYNTTATNTLTGSFSEVNNGDNYQAFDNSAETPPVSARGGRNKQEIVPSRYRIWRRRIFVVVAVVAVAIIIAVVIVFVVDDTPLDPEPTKVTASDAASNDWFGQSVATDGDTIVIGAYRASNERGSKSGSAYVYTRSGTVWAEQAKLLGSDGADGDQFGASVAIYGDTVVIGADRDDDNGEDSGSAYVYTRTGSAWTEQAKLMASNAAAGDEFGWSLGIHGDTIVIGAWSGSGTAYVYARSGIVWTEQAKLTDGADSDRFGWSVAISVDTLVISAYFDDAHGENSGSAYVYTRTGTVWSNQAKLTASDAAAEDRFGYSVAIHGDTLVIGSYWDDDSGSSSGSAYVYARSGTVWTEQAKLTASDAAGGDQFGDCVAMDGDTIIVGAVNDDDKGSGSGSAYIYKRIGTVWTEQTKLTAGDDATLGDHFGDSVGIKGDTIVVGATQDDDNGDSSGSVYIF